MRKKGVSLSLNTMIIAILVIIVLVVLVYIFTQRASIFGRSLEGPTCSERGGGEAASSTECGPDSYFTYAPNDERTETVGCCVPIEREEG